MWERFVKITGAIGPQNRFTSLRSRHFSAKIAIALLVVIVATSISAAEEYLQFLQAKNNLMLLFRFRT